jgi:hypothetical protein
MLEKMAMKQRHSTNNGIGKIHHEIHGSPHWDIYSVQPLRGILLLPILGIGKEVHLMDVKWMHLVCIVHHFPVLVAADVDAHHGFGARNIGFAIYEEPMIVLCEINGERRCTLLECRQLVA